MLETFPTKQRGDRLSAKQVNKLSGVAARFGRSRTGTNLLSRHRDSALLIDSPPAFDQALMEVTEVVGNDLYYGKTRYYNHDPSNLGWKTATDEQGWLIDASGIGLSFGTADNLICYWDSQRRAFVPIYGSGNWYLAKTGGSGIPKRVGTVCGKATVNLVKINSFDALVDHRDADSELVTRTCYNIATSSDVAANTYIQMARETLSGKYIAVWEDCA